MPQTAEWEFLLQQEGDRAWLPLDSPDVEILEGRYRIVARSKHPQTIVTLRIAHDAIDEDPPKRRSQTRTVMTNAAGLVVIAPYTTIAPGFWQIQCSCGDAPTAPTPWDHTVLLHVLKHEADLLGDWDADDDNMTNDVIASRSTLNDQPEIKDLAPDRVPAVIAPVIFPSAFSTFEENVALEPLSSSTPSAEPTSVEEWLHQAEQMSQQIADDVLQEYGLAPDDVEPICPIAPSIADVIATPLPPLQIHLDQANYTARRGQTITIGGSIAPLDPLSTQSVTLTNAQLKLCLRDPQSAVVLVETEQWLPNSALPTSIHCVVTLPTDLQTHLVLGEVTLYEFATDSADVQKILAIQPFAVTADASELLDVIATQPTATFLEPTLELTSLPVVPPTLANAEPMPLNLTFLNMVASAKVMSCDLSAAEVERILPPQLYSAPASEERKGLDLPDFFAPADQKAAAPDATTSRTMKLDRATLDQLREQEWAKAAERNGPAQNPFAIGEFEFHQVEPRLDLKDVNSFSAPQDVDRQAFFGDSADGGVDQTVEPTVNETINLTIDGTIDGTIDAIDPATAADLERPSSIEDSVYRSDLLAAEKVVEFDALGTESRDRVDGIETRFLAVEPIAPPIEPLPPADLSVYEFVVDSEPILPFDQLALSRGQKPSHVALNPANNPFLLPADAPVPSPQLAISAEELTAGQPVSLRITMPELQPKIYVKVWLSDRQQRTVLEGPRWVSEFAPNGFGALEAIAEFNVPLGCVDVEFAAIAIEMTTQRESHKETLTRFVTAASDLSDLNELSLNDWWNDADLRS